MTFFSRLNAQFLAIQYAELLCRIVVAALCGALVGVERSRRFKDAGVRTHCMVACSAAIMMIVSKYGFADLTDAAGAAFAGTRSADPARIAAQIVSGIGFLGAGIIYRNRHLSTKGLTTAAGIWAVAGIGMATGAGLYVIALFATAFVVVLQWATHRFVVGNDRYIGAELEIVLADDAEAIGRLHKCFERWGLVVTDSSIAREDDLVSYDLEVKLPARELQQEISLYLTADPAVRSIKVTGI